MLKPEIIEIEERKLIGIKILTNIADEASTQVLWQAFMPRRNELTNKVNEDLYSIQDYSIVEDLSQFNEETTFIKWAAMEVENLDTIPEKMETITIPKGKYAVFIHKGPTSTFMYTAQQIYNMWLPKSGYLLDDRTQFEIMGEKYKGAEHPESEEEIWIPIREM